ncbi:MAG: YceI family protein [Bacteroidetes bacterium]|nr:YceI family protein [Bacteroidota bacterium]
MKKVIKSRVVILIVSLLIAQGLPAQEKYKLVQDKSNLKVKGTSTVHDWEMIAEKVNSELQVVFNDQGNFEFKDVSVVCQAEKILSDNSIMDSKTHKALKTSKYPTISFKMKSLSNFKIDNSTFSGEINGYVKIAGVTKQITFKFSGNIISKDKIEVNGVVPLKMSDFNIEPPTAMLGALKTGNEVEVEYTFYFNRI